MFINTKPERIMNMRIALIATVVVTIFVPACNAQRPLATLNRPLPDGVKLVPPVGYELNAGINQVVPKPWEPPNGQHVIPRYANGKSHPAGSLMGWGNISVIRATKQTALRPVPALVITEDFGQRMNMFTAGSGENTPAVLEPYIGFVKLSGYDPTGGDWSGTGGKMHSQSWAATPFAYDLMRIQASAPTIEHVEFFGCPGTCLYVARGGGRLWGQSRVFDNEKAFIHDCRAQRALRGFEINVVDAVVGRIEGWNFRDYGIKFTNGGDQIDGALHFYGIDRDGTPGAAIWFTLGAGPCWADAPFYAENAKLGVWIESSGNALGKIYSKACDEANIKIGGERNTIDYVDLEVEADSDGIIIGTQFNKILSGSIDMQAASATGVRILSGGNAGNGIVLRDLKFLGRSQTLGTAITVLDPLNNCTMYVHFQNVGTGLDLDAAGVSKIGNNNTIVVTTSGDVLTAPIDLPDTWTTTPTATTNYVTINGVRWYPP
jgi:hypothetical protein